MAGTEYMNVSGSCPNCNGAAQGRFCSTCGQEQRIVPLTFGGMLREAFQEFTDVDGRLIKTLVTLLIVLDALQKTTSVVEEHAISRRYAFT